MSAEEFAASILSSLDAMRLQPVSELEPHPLSWLWLARLAFGKLAIIDGDPGLGKSLLALDLCARLSRARAMPDGSPGPGVCNSIFLNAEDDARDTTRSRLSALNADPARVFAANLQDDPNLLTLPSQTRELEEHLVRTQARLVVLDPVADFLDPSVNENSNRSVRRALMPLAMLAEKYEAVILLLRHLNKTYGGRSIYRGGGSMAFLGMCRSGWLLASDPGAESRRVLAQLKNNLGPAQPSLAFSMHFDAGAASPLEFLGVSELSADALLAARPGKPSSPERSKASSFLADLLRKGPRTSRDIWRAALPLGLSKRTLFRARRDMNVRVESLQEGTRRTNYWLLPEQPSLAAEPADAGMRELERQLNELREQYPPSTPLDEE